MKKIISEWWLLLFSINVHSYKYRILHFKYCGKMLIAVSKNNGWFCRTEET